MWVRFIPLEKRLAFENAVKLKEIVDNYNSTNFVFINVYPTNVRIYNPSITFHEVLYAQADVPYEAVPVPLEPIISEFNDSFNICSPYVFFTPCLIVSAAN